LRRRVYSAVAAVLFTLLIASYAQARALDERDFWLLLQETDLSLQQAISQPTGQRSAIIAEVRALWDGIDTVRLADQTSITVDMEWLRTGLSTDTATLQGLRQRIRALLDYHAQHSGVAQDVDGSLAALDRVLQNPRFHYPDATPAPPPSLPDIPVSSDLGLIVLAIAGLIAAVAALTYFARLLSIQRAAVPMPPEPGDDPSTSTAARERAMLSEGAQDYRSAIRYFYLSSLLTLDERGLIHYDRALTNREHLRQIVGNPQLLKALSPVVHTFDRVWYGFAPVDESLYQDFRRNVERLEQLTP
jgi:hypothetical protein